MYRNTRQVCLSIFLFFFSDCNSCLLHTHKTYGKSCITFSSFKRFSRGENLQEVEATLYVAEQIQNVLYESNSEFELVDMRRE